MFATSCTTNHLQKPDGEIYIDEPVFARCDKNDDNDFSDTGEEFYYLHNTLYSVHAILDASGNIIEVYKNYQPFGAVTVYTGDGGDGDWWDGDETTGSLSGNYYLFTGRRYDPEADLMFYRNRIYLTSRGRFLQRDPIGYRLVFNLYTYVVNNPIKWLDPSGLRELMPGPGEGGMIEVPYWEYSDTTNLSNSQQIDRIMDQRDFERRLYGMTWAEYNAWVRETYGDESESPLDRFIDDIYNTGSDILNEIREYVYGDIAHDYGYEIWLGIGAGEGVTYCCDHLNRKWKIDWAKECKGIGFSASLSTHMLEGLNGENCPHGYTGIFYEGAVPIAPFVSVSAEHSDLVGNPDSVGGIGLSVGFSVFPTIDFQAGWCDYNYKSWPEIVGKCCSE